jgi:hypothetical protein
MSFRQLRVRRILVLPALAVPAMLLPSAAAADPPALNRDPCTAVLAGAASWPGTIETPDGTVRLVSDGYVTHLAAQSPCGDASGT